MIEILWQCHACVVVNKPVGLPTTSPKGTDSLESCLLIALRKKAARLLSEQFRLRHVQKKYIAMVQGNALEACKQEPWKDTIAKLPDEARVKIVGPDTSDGRDAETKVSFLEYDSASDTSRIELRPITGRMHQLRIQSAHRGHPIVGDPLYGNAADESALRLVAAKLSFRDPTNGRATDVALSSLPF